MASGPVLMEGPTLLERCLPWSKQTWRGQVCMSAFDPERTNRAVIGASLFSKMSQIYSSNFLRNSASSLSRSTDR